MQPWVYIVLLGAAALLYALRLPSRSKEDPAERQSLKETEAALELYMSDIERENTELLQLVAGIKQQSQNNRAATQEEIAALRQQIEDLKQSAAKLEARVAAEEQGLAQLSAAVAQAATVQAAASAETDAAPVPAPAPKAPVSSIKLRYPRLFELHEEGKSIDAIAKMAGLQRGEVQLILQLAKQEESL